MLDLSTTERPRAESGKPSKNTTCSIMDNEQPDTGEGEKRYVKKG
jgi:hypothetical protein